MRGFAAIAVIDFHAGIFFGKSFVQHGYLAVDFFFMLSGFVLTLAYQNKLDAGWSTAAFLKIRFNRLYPLHFLGLALGLISILAQRQLGFSHLAVSSILRSLIAGILLLPVPTAAIRGFIPAFIFNVPTWSLFSEAVANILHALVLRRRSRRYLMTLTTVCALAIIACAIRFHTIDLGSNGSQILYGLIRISFSYTLGVLLFLFWKDGKLSFALNPAVAISILLLILVIPRFARFNSVYDLVIAVLVFPVLLVLSANSHVSPRLLRLSETLGASSYAMYVLHYPFGYPMRIAWDKLRRHSAELDNPWPHVAFILFVLAVSLLADRFYDIPLRRLLAIKTSVNGRPKAPAEVSRFPPSSQPDNLLT